MKKDNKQKTANSPTSTTPPKTSVHSAGTKTQKEDTKVDKPKWDKNTIVTVIVGVVTVIVGIVSIAVSYQINRQNIEDKEIESLTTSINNSIIEIKESFNPDAIETDSLSSPDFRYVKSFQDTVKKAAESWLHICRASSKSELEKYDTDRLWSITKTLIKNGEYYDNKIKNITEFIDTIENYGKQNKIDDYLVSDDKRLFLQIDESQSTTLNYMAMCIIDCKNSSKNYDKKMVKFIKKFEKMRKSKNNLENIDVLFATIIELNDMYMNHINDEIKKRQILQATIGRNY